MANTQSDATRPMIEFRDVWKAFDAPILSGISLIVAEGEKLAIVGPSGTGKSVLLKTTIGLVVPDRGDVWVEGQAVFSGQRSVLESIRRKIGYVFQYSALFDSLNVYDNVAMGLPERELETLAKDEVAERVAQALDSVNLDPARLVAKIPSELSGGMRKRVGLARAIVGRPRILLYDEPVTGLDPVNAAGVDRLISKVADEYGVTSIIVTHDVQGVLAIADRIALLDHGQLRFVGTPDEFRKSDDRLVRAFADREVAVALSLEEERA